MHDFQARLVCELLRQEISSLTGALTMVGRENELHDKWLSRRLDCEILHRNLCESGAILSPAGSPGGRLFKACRGCGTETRYTYRGYPKCAGC